MPDKQDLFQEILYQLWKSFPTFRGEAKVSTWMYQIALNTAITNFKKTKRRIITQDLSEQHSVADFSENADTEERLKELYQAINQLNSIEKAIIMLYLEENTYQEIAKIMGITENNVGVKINRIKTKLKQLLDELLNC